MITHMLKMEEEVKQELEKRYPDCRVKLSEVQKNNDLKKKGVSILAAGKNIAPTIYIDEYMEKQYSVLEICNEVSKLYEGYKDTGELKIDITDYHSVRNRICFKLINADKNKELLEQIPHRRLHDLAVIYYILLDDQFDGMATIKVNGQMMESWGVQEEELYTCAVSSTRELLHGTFVPMEMVIGSLIQDADLDTQSYETVEKENCTFQIGNVSESSIFILSNKESTFGAAMMLYTYVLQDIAEFLKRSFYILPSSTHELLIVPDHSGIDKNDLLQMVQEVNKNEVSQEDFLSDNVYYWDADKSSLDSLFQ